MRDHETLTEDDEGKDVVNSEGDKIGRVVSVDHGKVHVDPDPGLTDKIRSKLGWGEEDEEDYVLEESNIETVSDNEIRLSR